MNTAPETLLDLKYLLMEAKQRCVELSDRITRWLSSSLGYRHFCPQWKIRTQARAKLLDVKIVVVSVILFQIVQSWRIRKEDRWLSSNQICLVAAVPTNFTNACSASSGDESVVEKLSKGQSVGNSDAGTSAYMNKFYSDNTGLNDICASSLLLSAMPMTNTNKEQMVSRYGYIYQ